MHCMHCSLSLKIAWVAKETSLLCPHPASIFHPTTRFLKASVHTTKICGSTKIPPGGMISLSGPWTNTFMEHKAFGTIAHGVMYAAP